MGMAFADFRFVPYRILLKFNHRIIRSSNRGNQIKHLFFHNQNANAFFITEVCGCVDLWLELT